ncbi:MAG: histidyl-tRNA synthetase [Bradymonadia bacterium]|jgi:histidyl-tRNA synthetase
MISTKPPSGTRDFLPDAVRARRWAIDRVQTAYERHGFAPLETPTMERLDVLMGKYGDEGDQLMFKVLKRRDALPELTPETDAATLTDLGLRFDLTVPLARVAAAYRNDLPKFFKRYQVQPVWRADRPQKGRFREFYQCDVDFLGTTSLHAEVSVMSAVADALDALGFDNVTTRMNDRRILTGFLEAAGVPHELHSAALVAVDKLDKIGPERVREEWMTRGLTEAMANGLTPMLAGVLDEPAQDTLASLAELFGDKSSAGIEGVETLQALFALLDGNANSACRFVFDPTLARGLSYYTGPIFELNVDDLAGSVGGGGRYDNLIGMFSKNEVPAVGCALGLERLLVVMEQRGMLPSGQRSADVMIAWLDKDAEHACASLARDVRETGLRTEVYPEKAKLGKQLQYAESLGIRHVLIYGSREVEAGHVLLKDLDASEQHLKQREVPRSDIGAALEAVARG